MSDEEWTILGQLDPLLNVCNPSICLEHYLTMTQALLFAMKKVSHSATPLIHDVIPVIDSLTTFFDKSIDDATLHPSVRHAALHEVLMLNKYYAKTDESVVYQIAMSMSLSSFTVSYLRTHHQLVFHPELKLDYFKKARWLPEWIAEARRLAPVEWEARYKPTLPRTPLAPASSSSPRTDVSHLSLVSCAPSSYGL
jgi:hypothetical protein